MGHHGGLPVTAASGSTDTGNRPWLLLALVGWLCAIPFVWAGLLLGKSAIDPVFVLALWGPWILLLPAIAWFYKASRLRSGPFVGWPLVVAAIAAAASLPLVMFINLGWGYVFAIVFCSQLLPITAYNCAFALYKLERRRAGIAEPLVSLRAKAVLSAAFGLLILGDVLKFSELRAWPRLQTYSRLGAETTPGRYRRLPRLKKGVIEFQQTGEETPATFACLSPGALIFVEGPGAGCTSLWLERLALDEGGGRDWSRCLDVPPGSLARGIACAPDGKTYLAGTDPQLSEPRSANRWWLRAVGADGLEDERWRASFEKRAYFFRPNSIALDPGGALYVAGEEGGVDWNAERYAWIRKFDLSGREARDGWPKSLVWDARSSSVEPSSSGPPGSAHNGLWAKKIAVAPTGELFAALEHEIDSTVFVRYAPDGSRLPFPLEPHWRGSLVELAVDPGGRLVLAGDADCPGEPRRRAALVAKLRADGTPLWTTALGCSRRADSALRAIAFDGDSLYAGGAARDLLFDGSGEDWWIDRIGPSGAPDPAFAVRAGHRANDRVTRLLVSDGRLLALGLGGGYAFSRSIWDVRLR